MNEQSIERLAANPHYRMTPKQIAELERVRAKVVIHRTGFPRHDTSVPKHPYVPPKEEEESDERAD